MTTLADIVSKRLSVIGRGPTQAEDHGKLGKNYITDIVGGNKRDIRASYMPRLAKALDWSVQELQAEMQAAGLRPADVNEAVPSDVPGAAVSADQLSYLPLDIPVYGVAAASVVGCFVIDGQIDVVRRPPGLAQARNIYALYVHGESMFPRHRSGDLIFVSPDRPPRSGDDVVVQTRNHPGDVIQSWLKEFDHSTEDVVLVRQLNPASTIEFRQDTVVSVHRVLSMRELFGA